MMTISTAQHLQAPAKAANIASLTKKHHTQCQALNMAFFMPKIRAFLCAMGMKDRNRISKYGRVKAQNKRPFNGNMCSRVMRLSDTRPPETKTGGLTKKHHGGQTMPNTSQAPTIGQFSISLQLPEQSFIKGFTAHYLGSCWTLTLETERGQIATIQDLHTQQAKRFHSLDRVAQWLAAQEVPAVTVLLDGINGGRK